MEGLIPTSTHWITFPVYPGDAVWINWREGGLARSAVYYVSKCFWGHLDNKDINDRKGEAGKPICALEKDVGFVIKGM
jgi:hypothetical protein